MGLLGNYTILNSNPGREIGGFTNLYSSFKPSKWYSFYSGDNNSLDNNGTSILRKASFPTGTQPPYSFVLAIRGGELASTTKLNGSASQTFNLTRGVNIASTLVGLGTITASAKVITNLNSLIPGLGTLTSSLVGSIALQSTVSGTSNVSSQLSLISSMISSMIGSSSVNANLKGHLSLDADIFVNQSEATVEQIVQAVWDAMAADFNNSGTMGEIMNNMGSVADPWTTPLPGSYTGTQAGNILLEYMKKIKAISSANL